MSITNKILVDADAALMTAMTSQGSNRLQAMIRFMDSFERLAREVDQGAATWDEARPWALRNAERLCAAHDALTDWQLELGRLLYNGDEEAVERALDRRSQHALARELFHGTPADEMLAGYEAEDVDRDFRARADGYALDLPSWFPRSHTWWRWKAE